MSLDNLTTCNSSKQCVQCWQEFSCTPEFFQRHISNTDGFSQRCRKCVAGKRRAEYAKNPEKYRQQKRAYILKHRNAINERNRQWAVRFKEKYGLSKSTAYKHANREKMRQWRAEYRRKNPEKFQAAEKHRYDKFADNRRRNSLRWAKENPKKVAINNSNRRARLQCLPATMTDAVWNLCMQYWSYSCAICGNEEGFMWTLAMDHWIPLSHPRCLGTVPENILPLCHGRGGCNNQKREKDPHIWLIHKLGKYKAHQKEKAIAEYFCWIHMKED